MQYTNNYNLNKPDAIDVFSRNDQNTNMDLIDAQINTLRTDLETTITDLETTTTITEQKPVLAKEMGKYAEVNTLTSSIVIKTDPTRNYAKFDCLAGETYEIQALTMIFDNVGAAIGATIDCTTKKSYTCPTNGTMYVNYSASGTYSIVKIVDIVGTANYFTDQIDTINTNLSNIGKWTKVYNTVTYSCPSGTTYNLYPLNTLHSGYGELTVNGDGTVSVKESGDYMIMAKGTFTASTSGTRRQMAVYIDAAALVQGLELPSNQFAFLDVVDVYTLNPNQKIKIFALQDSGSNITFGASLTVTKLR